MRYRLFVYPKRCMGVGGGIILVVTANSNGLLW